MSLAFNTREERAAPPSRPRGARLRLDASSGGRARALGRGPALALLVAVLGLTRAAWADDVISDPELDGPRAGKDGTPKAVSGEQTISDPELDGKKTAAPAPPAPSVPAGEPTVWRVVLQTRWGVDTRWERPSEDVFEETTIGVVEAQQRASDDVFYSVGIRGRHADGWRQDGKSHYSLDAVPVSGFVDARVADGMHLRAGYQVTQLGRFDLFSATNFLAVYDLRSGPVTMPDASAVAQPALRFDVDRIPGLTIQAYYVPFFQPNIVDVYGTDYALLSGIDRELDRSLNPARASLERELNGRSGVLRASNGIFGAFTPEPNLATPQGALRATLHGTAGELSATVGTALEHLPTPRIGTGAQIFGNTLPAFGADYGRFWVASIDGATDIGPVQVGFEGAFMKDRTLGATRDSLPPGASTLTPSTDCQQKTPTNPDACPFSRPGRTDMAQGGLRAEFVQGTEWAVGLESFVAVALEQPSQQGILGTRKLTWGTLEQGRYWKGVAGAVSWSPEKTGLRFDLAGIAFSGPSYAILPRAEWEAFTRVYFELGAVFVEGPWKGAYTTAAPNISIGGFFSDVDQVFMGIRWMP